MKKKKAKNSFRFLGALLFFITIGFAISVAIVAYDSVSKLTNSKTEIALLILSIIIVLSLLCTIIDYVRRKTMIDRPVQRILDATEKIAEGNFDTKLEIPREYDKYNEYDLIMHNVNLMSAELKKSEVLKTDFVSNVSHEIKTPLTVIQSYAFMLQQDDIDLETRKKCASTLITASKKLSDLITNILKLNKLENQEINAEKSLFNLTASLENAVLSFENLIEQKSLQLECDLDGVSIYSSESLLELVWNNLLSNAIKFTPENGKIGVSLKAKNNDIFVKISDTGYGISRQTGERMFEKFYQGDSSHSQEGNGLGLALVKKVIDILGGEISVESQLNVGSIFTVTLKGVMNE